MTVTVRLVALQRADEGRGHSMARMEELPDGWLFHGTEVSIEPETTLSCGFRILLDTEGQTREVDVASVSAAGEVRLSLRVDDERRWWRNGGRDPELDGCLDVDVAATPLTNTFPIRRYEALAVGESVTTAIAWVDVPSPRGQSRGPDLPSPRARPLALQRPDARRVRPDGGRRRSGGRLRRLRRQNPVIRAAITWRATSAAILGP